jgi:hypothetical protein
VSQPLFSLASDPMLKIRGSDSAKRRLSTALPSTPSPVLKLLYLINELFLDVINSFSPRSCTCSVPLFQLSSFLLSLPFKSKMNADKHCQSNESKGKIQFGPNVPVWCLRGWVCGNGDEAALQVGEDGSTGEEHGSDFGLCLKIFRCPGCEEHRGYTVGI